MPDTNADTPDTFSGTVLFRVTKPTRYAARLLLWQWKQWLNRGADWNNPSVCPLVPQTSCLTKLNPSWCRAFRPVSLCYSVSLFFFFIRCLFLSFWLRPGPLFGSLGTGPIYFFSPACRQPLWEAGWDWGEWECKDTEGWTESRIRGKVKQAWNRELKTENTEMNTGVTLKGQKRGAGKDVWEKVRAEEKR